MTDPKPPKAPKAPAAPPAPPSPYTQQQPYGGVAYAPVTGPPTNVLAIIALILGFLVPPGGIVCGHIALGQIKRTGEGGRGLALAGTILGYVLTGIGILVVVINIVIWVAIIGSGVLEPGTVI